MFLQGRILSTSGDAQDSYLFYITHCGMWLSHPKFQRDLKSQVSKEIHVNNGCSFLKHMKVIVQSFGNQ